ncbi:hypothetical protein RM553_11480 [Zunongwangia sp. F363]|uniref:Uncharacterized protein n=1 Tax=Autumnicola tepida TaxID=3075595 RepID=A0ABU3CB11_9FLAO|nr:hypothetical protein [Zunongwangia sp. F363]MDT0643453.1 hypothetical protein [Zunongwangia sp. F363]
MKKFKVFFTSLAVFVLFFTSCDKDETATEEPEVSTDIAYLSFGPVLNSMLNRAALRQEVSDLPVCSDAAPAYVQLSLTYGDSNIPVEVTVGVLSDENGFFTAYDDELEIPVPSGSTTVAVTLTDFLVLSDNGGSPGDIIWAAPKTGSTYAAFVDQPLPMSWDLRAGSKTYMDIPVLCFDNRQVNLYGYLFFDIIPSQVSTLCFFANYCTPAGRHYTANYSLDLYLGTSAAGIPLYLDQMPATGMDEDNYADPVCLGVPAPADGIGDDDPYLYYEITLMDWPGNYGTAGDYVETGTLSWNEVEALLNEDGTTAEYEHVFINCGESEEPGQDTYVLLTIDTENITENNMNTTVVFTDDRSDISENPGDPDSHVALVDKGMKIYWMGQPLNSNSDVTIQILDAYRKPEGGPVILTDVYTSSSLEGVLIGQIREDYVSEPESYSIVFRINDGETQHTYTIDPKLKMSSSTTQ